MKILFVLLCLVPVPAAGQAAAKRLVATARSILMATGEWKPYDSTRIEYDRPSGRTPYDFNYVNYNIYGPDDDPIWEPSFVHGPAGFQMPTLARAVLYDLHSQPAPRIQVVTTYDRDVAGKLRTFTRRTYFADTTQSAGTSYTYEYEENRVRRIRAQEWTQGAWRKDAERVLIYDRDRRSGDSIFVFDAGGAVAVTTTRRWEYDGQGRVSRVASRSVQNGTPYEWDFQLTYDGQGRVTHLRRLSNGVVDRGDTLTYTGKNAFWTTQISNEYRVTKHLNARGLPDTAFWVVRGLPSARYVLRYDQDGQLVEEDQTGYSAAGASTSFSLVRYYYETAPDTVDVPLPVNVQVFPNPATDAVTVSWKNAPYGAVYRLYLTDLLGRPLFSRRVVWQGSDEVIPVAHLARAVYLLQVAAERTPLATVVKICKP